MVGHQQIYQRIIPLEARVTELEIKSKVLLISCRQWLGSSRLAIDTSNAIITPIDMLVSFVTKLSAQEAFDRLAAYQATYNKKNATALALEFTPLSVTVIDGISNEALLTFVNIQWIEDLNFDDAVEYPYKNKL